MPAKSSKPSPGKGLSQKQGPAKTSPVEGAPAPKKTPRLLKRNTHEISPEDRHRMVAETAYFIAERRGFSGGRHEGDWYEAEQIVMQSLSRKNEDFH